MHVTAHWGCMNTATESALKDDCWGRRSGGGEGVGEGEKEKKTHLAAPGDRTSVSVRHCTT